MKVEGDWVVLKFGGTSVARASHWKTILSALDSCLSQGLRPLLVCSALSGVSDALERLLETGGAGDAREELIGSIALRHERLASELGVPFGSELDGWRERTRGLLDEGKGGEVAPRARAELMASGELLSTRIGARWLAGRGRSVEWLDARTLLTAKPAPTGACETQQYLSAGCAHDEETEVRERMKRISAEIAVTQGFIASDRDGDTVLLGRGGSDTAAACLAAKIGARRLEIWTDVPGVFTANPRAIPAARLVYRLDYGEAEALAGLGATVLHPRSILPVQEARIPLEIRWTARPDVRGTVVKRESSLETRGLKAVTARDDLCLVTMRRRQGWQPVGFLADVSACFKRHAISMDLLSNSSTSIKATVDLDDRSGVRERVPALVADLAEVCSPEVRYDVSSVSLVGRGIRRTLHEFVSTLELVEGLDVLMVTQAANDLFFTLVVPGTQSKALLSRLHRQLFEEYELDDHFGGTWAELTGDRARKEALLEDAPIGGKA